MGRAILSGRAVAVPVLVGSFFCLLVVAVDASAGASDERAFRAVEEWALAGRKPDAAHYTDIFVVVKDTSLRWQSDRVYKSEFHLYRRRRPKGDPGGLNRALQTYFEGRGWRVSQGISDHYGQRVYRILVTFSKGKTSFTYIFEATDEGGNTFDNWSERLSLVSDKDVDQYPVCGEVRFDSFFREILLWVKDRKHRIAMQKPYFHLNVYPQPIDHDVPGGTLQLSLSFSCAFGEGSTLCGMQCYERLYEEFLEYLKRNHYEVAEVQDFGTSGWAAVVNKATGPGHSFLFLFESESARSMGYASIGIVVPPGTLKKKASN
jgi:hypothetical protein